MVLAEFDPDANALYVRLVDNSDKKIVKTIPLSDGSYLDVTEDNQPVGIELILPAESLTVETTRILSNLQIIK